MVWWKSYWPFLPGRRSRHARVVWNSLNIFGNDFTCHLETGKTDRSEITDKSILEGMKQHVASVQVQFMKNLTSECDHMIHSFEKMEEHMRVKMNDNDDRMDVLLSEIIDLLKTQSPEHSQPCDCPTDSQEAMTERTSSVRDTLMKAAIPGHPCAYIVWRWGRFQMPAGLPRLRHLHHRLPSWQRQQPALLPQRHRLRLRAARRGHALRQLAVQLPYRTLRILSKFNNSMFINKRKTILAERICTFARVPPF